MKVALASFGLVFPDIPRLSTHLVVSDPFDLCSPLSESVRRNASGAILLALRGTCEFVDKASRAEEAGARLLVIVNNKPGPPETIDAPNNYSNHHSIAVVMVSNVDGQHLRQVSDKVIVAAPAADTASRNSERSLSDFSGRGPTMAGRTG